MSVFENYEEDLKPDGENSLAKIIEKIKPQSIILDVGCSSGALGLFLVEHKQCIVDGVDLDQDAIEICRSRKYRNLAVKNLELDGILDVFKKEDYDCIVIADVLEHLVNPNKLLSQLKELIKPDGIIILSVPNVSHIASALELLSGKFHYRSNGLLDSTHVRFYTYESLLSKLTEFGFFLWDADKVIKSISETEFGENEVNLFPKNWINAILENRADALVYQWILTVKKYPSPNKLIYPQSKQLTKPKKIQFDSELFWKSKEESHFSKESMIVGFFEEESSNDFRLNFYFKNLPKNGIDRIRVDLLSNNKAFWIKEASIIKESKKIIWRWDGYCGPYTLVNLISFSLKRLKGSVFFNQSNDPQWLPEISEYVLNQISEGDIFSIVIGKTTI